MPSTKEFVFNASKFNPYIIGDLGVADRIFTEDVQPKINQCKTPKDKLDFQNMIYPVNKKTGLWALEKTFLSSSVELNKSIIELNKHALELMGHLEYLIACISGGPNPYNLSSSFLYNHKNNINDLNKFKTSFEPNNLASSGQVNLPPPQYPDVIFLGRFNSTGDQLDPSNEQQDKFYLENQGNYVWPQYQSKDDFISIQTELTRIESQNIDEPYKSLLLNSRPKSFDNEWDDLNNNNQLRQISYLPLSLKKPFMNQTVEFQSQFVDVSIEEDYNVQVFTSNDENELPIFTIVAYLKESVKVLNSPFASAGQQSQQPQTPDPIPPQSYSRAANFFFNKTIKLLFKKYLPIIIKIKKLLGTPDKYIGDVLIKGMLDNYEMFDLSLQTKPENHPIRQKYFYKKTFVLDGVSNINLEKFNVNLEIKNQALKMNLGQKQGTQQTTTLMIMNLFGFITRYIHEMTDAFASIIVDLFDLFALPTVVPNFLSFKVFKDVVTQPNIIKLLGGKNNDILTIPAWIPPPQKNPEMERSFKKTMTYLMNAYLDFINIAFNQKLAQPVSF